MHDKPMCESDGVFKAPEQKRYKCRKCHEHTATCRVWESSCGGFEDEKFECQNPSCRFVWWIDGIDS